MNKRIIPEEVLVLVLIFLIATILREGLSSLLDWLVIPLIVCGMGYMVWVVVVKIAKKRE